MGYMKNCPHGKDHAAIERNDDGTVAKTAKRI